MNSDAEMPLLMGYDDRSVLYDADSYVLRKIRPEYFDEIAHIYATYQEHHLDEKGIVATQIDRSAASLTHRKHIISYPYEWTASMFKCAVLFHLRLFEDLDASELTLKDALPSNVLFLHTEPVFVDFSSLVFQDKLRDEKWLMDGTSYSDPRFAVFDKMFVPYLLIPLTAMAIKKHALARTLLSEKACNCAGGEPQWRDLGAVSLPAAVAPGPLAPLLNLVSPLLPAHSRQIAKIAGLLGRRQSPGFNEFIARLSEQVAGMEVTPPRSDYLSYYENKKEDFDFEDQSPWNAKQKSVRRLLDSCRPGTVLDLGANTGWFSILAAKLGASVIATDIDESCIDSLFLFARQHKLPILPLVLSFDQLTREIFGTQNLECPFGGRDPGTNPLFSTATRRLKSEMVLCLGLIHHLVLGMGKEIGEVMKVLSDLTAQLLVLEFVSIDDELIQGDPPFFQNLQKFSRDTYRMEIAIAAGLKFFRSCKVMDSDCSTRKLLVFTKEP